jgi:vacuolar protein sorting-associated protein 29
MKRVLVFGDTHIPTRRDSVPAPFYRHIEETKYDFALVTGDLVREADMRDALPALPDCYIVQGNMDYSSDYRHHEQMKIEGFDVLLLHGTQLRPRGNIKELYDILGQTGSDVGVHGHTHNANITLHKGRLFLNPGTLSGATGGWAGLTDASFIELEVSASNMDVTLHFTDWKVVKRSSMQFRKQDEQIIQMR